MPPTPRMEPIPGPDEAARLHAPTGLPRQAKKPGTRFVMRLSLIALLLACLWMSACAAPMQDRALQETHAAPVLAGHGTVADSPDMRIASPDPSIPDGLRPWHRTPPVAELSDRRDVLRSRGPGPVPDYPNPLSWDPAFGQRVWEWAGNGCDAVSTGDDGYAGWDMFRSLCLFADNTVSPIPAGGASGFGHAGPQEIGLRNRIADCVGFGCPESTHLNGKQGKPLVWTMTLPTGISRAVGLQARTRFVSVGAGWHHTCGVWSDNTVQCWGWDYYGQAASPVERFTAVSTGGEHTCGVRIDNTVQCWGRNDDGQATPPGGRFVTVSTGEAHTCGVRIDNTVQCWGRNNDGQATLPGGRFVAVSAGAFHTCGVRIDGTAQCWGRNSYGQARPPAGRFVAVSAGGEHTCGVQTEGALLCWGANGAGWMRPPVGRFVSVSAGYRHACGVRSDNTVQCWGRNDDGQAAPPGGEFTTVNTGHYHTCGVRVDGTIQCWGWNGAGQATPPNIPTISVSPGTPLASLHAAAGNGNTLTVERLLADGADPNMVDGNGETALHNAARHGHVLVADQLLKHGANPDVINVRRSTPLHLAAWFGHEQVVSLLLAHGAVSDLVDSWGDTPLANAVIQGHTRVARLIELAADPALPNQRYVSVSAGGSHTCGVRTDDTVLCWGWNEHGQA
ncbi:MAG: hypothetical protein F4X16_13545, partial [Caldilineaceae bacterium SB0661_bin_34]|nr:hypothetical protein [Caldilineaceae bacterium SB0661_bin_34]